MPNFARLLADFRPNAEWTLPEVNDYSTLIWVGPGQPPTERQLLNREDDYETLREDVADARAAIATVSDPRVRAEFRNAVDPEALYDNAAERLRQAHPNRAERRNPAEVLKAIEDAKVGGPPPRPIRSEDTDVP